jgi:hypothetical protein
VQHAGPPASKLARHPKRLHLLNRARACAILLLLLLLPGFAAVHPYCVPQHGLCQRPGPAT